MECWARLVGCAVEVLSVGTLRRFGVREKAIRCRRRASLRARVRRMRST